MAAQKGHSALPVAKLGSPQGIPQQGQRGNEGAPPEPKVYSAWQSFAESAKAKFLADFTRGAPGKYLGRSDAPSKTAAFFAENVERFTEEFFDK
ncbi:hypothetical protein MTO96_032702 [Rhipicephalus appendiculatus]